jgi:hypothetical protein
MLYVACGIAVIAAVAWFLGYRESAYFMSAVLVFLPVCLLE